ncbi:hypothetical protein ABN763_14025 [Spongiivirga sp. MCCC 1A20706]|uniref:hypothetical protein n=1 Tax=Spongiivirga sp. MCCC 1A20706 TaxID=3160963 RepID=UPI003977C46B
MMKFTQVASMLLLGALVVTSCGNDDDLPPVQASCSDGIQNGTETGVDCGGTCQPCISEDTNLTGSMTEDRTLDASVAYTLTNTFSVEAGATLTIPAGTTITASVQSGSETNTYIVVQKGAQINIQGTSSNPVTMTSANDNPGDWGGLVIAGDATTTEGTDAIAEIGQIRYGGTNNSDNSGSINYLIIKNAGAQINAEAQYNGLTLYAVGSGTTITNVATINGEDDGVEFFGGTVSMTNFYSENNQDDSVDWTEGWNGTLTNAYIVHTEDGFSTAVEADGNNGNPSLVNLTAVSSVGGLALQFKKESGATITGLSLQGYTTSIDYKDNGALTNVTIDGETSNPALSYVAPATVDASLFDWVNSNNQVSTQVIGGSQTSDLTLDASISYFLKGTLSMEAGTTLTIPAGTKITADVEAGDETSTYIVIQKGATIDVQGTAANPVEMTSATETPGTWGGLVIAGDATTTEGTDAIAEVGQIVYGGTNDTDNSGSIRYLIIRYAGAQINAESQYNGLTLYAVGSGTSIEWVAAIDGKDDGVEFFGGTVSVTNFYSENNEDDSVDWTEGWNGTLTNTYVSHTISGFSTAIEADGANGNPTITNFTAVTDVNEGIALQFKKNSGATMTNVLLTNYVTNVDMKDDGPVANIIVDGTALTTVDDDVFNGTAVDVATFAWATGN